MTSADNAHHEIIPEHLFDPAPTLAGEAEVISRPTLSYLQDALIRLRRNRVAVASMATLALVLMTGVVGPWFFPASDVPYANAQNSDAINMSPGLGKRLLVVDESAPVADPLVDESFDLNAPVAGVGESRPPESIKVVGHPTVNAVTVAWSSVPGVAGYVVYRIITDNPEADVGAAVASVDARGMEVCRTSDGATRSCVDSAGLESGASYVYSVVSLAGDPASGLLVETPEAATVATRVEHSIGLLDAKAIDADARAGDTIRGRAYLFGTDSLGRDVAARMIQGTRVDFFLALVIPTLCLLIGLIYGAVSGLAGGRVDMVLMRIVEILDTLPALLMYVLVQLIIGKGVTSIIIAMTAFGWTGFARVIRGEVLRLREIEFVHASRLLGASTLRMVFHHIAPNLLGVILVMWSAFIPGVIRGEAFLSLLGLGLEPPDPSWGMVLAEAASRLRADPTQFFLPTSVLAVTLLAFFLLGDALSDAFDPKLRGRD